MWLDEVHRLSQAQDEDRIELNSRLRTVSRSERLDGKVECML